MSCVVCYLSRMCVFLYMSLAESIFYINLAFYIYKNIFYIYKIDLYKN